MSTLRREGHENKNYFTQAPDWGCVLAFVGLILLPKIGLIDYSIVPISLLLGRQLLLNKLVINIPSMLWGIIIAWTALFYLSVLTFLVNGSIGEIIIGKPPRQIIIIFFSYLLLSKNKSPISTAFYSLFIAGLINAIVIYIQYFLNAFGYSDNFLISPNFDAEINVAFRKPGLTAGYPTAGLLSLFGSISGLLILQFKKSKLVILCTILLIFTLVLTSRLALYLGMLVLLYWFLKFTNRSNIKILINIIIITSAPLIYLYVEGYIHSDTLIVMFELFTNYIDNSEIETESSTALIESFYYVPNFTTLIIGNGLDSLSDNLQSIDSGYQIRLFGGGLFYFLIFYIIYTLCWITIFSKKEIDKRIKIAINIIFLLGIICEIKGGVIFSRVVGDCIVILTAAFLSVKYSNASKSNQNKLLK